MDITPIPRAVPLRQQVYESLREQLRAGAFAPGERLTELGVAGLLGVSRTPVREALGQLAQEGFLEALPRGGFGVPALEARDIAEMFEVRELLEPHAVAEAARRAESKELAPLEQAIADEKACLDIADATPFMEANRRFRAALFALAGNARLARTIETFEDHAQYVRWVTLESHAVRRIVIAGQERLLAALAAKDPAAAETAMRAQLAAARTSLMDALGKCRPADIQQTRKRKSA